MGPCPFWWSFLAGPIVVWAMGRKAAIELVRRHVDAINEPDRPNSVRGESGRWGLWIALAMTVFILVLFGWQLGPPWGFPGPHKSWVCWRLGPIPAELFPPQAVGLGGGPGAWSFLFL